MTKPIQVQFSQGIQFPPKLGTLILKQTGEGKLAYAQNVDSFNDEYGSGAITPGPALTTIGNNSELTGVPFIKSFYGYGGTPTLGWLYMGQGLLGTKSVIRRVKDIMSGSTPTIDTDGSMTLDHASHTNQVLVDMLLRNEAGGDPNIYVAGKDNTDTWVYKFRADLLNPTPDVVAGASGNVVNSNFTGGFTDQFLVLGSDNNIYWIGKDRVSSIDTTDNYVVNALPNKLPLGTYASAGVDWNNYLVVAYSTEAFGDFGRRLSAGRSGVILWDYDNANFQKNILAPCRYISAMVVDPSGNLLVFGGMDEGKSSIYEFTGYGFNLLYTYIGDLPRSRHSIEFDGHGQLQWLTADGQFCRFDRSSGIFDHLGSVTTGSSAGGLLAKGIGSPIGNDFLLASGSGSSYTMKRVVFGNFIGDGAEADTIATPLAVSGIIQLPYKSTIEAITWHLSRPLQTGEKVILQIYQNGSTTPTIYSTLDFTADGGISAKREVLTLIEINNFSLGVLWKMVDAQATAPAVVSAEVDWN